MSVFSVRQRIVTTFLLCLAGFLLSFSVALADPNSLPVIPDLPASGDSTGVWEPGSFYQTQTDAGVLEGVVQINDDGSLRVLSADEIAAAPWNNTLAPDGTPFFEDGEPLTAPPSNPDPQRENFTPLQMVVYQFVRTAFGTLAFMTGFLMDQAINVFVLGFSELYLTSFGAVVESVWNIVRDLINVALVFGLVYIGFRFILFADDAAAKRNLVFLLMAALLVNFSLFFAKAIVDITNIAAYEFADVVRVDKRSAQAGVSFSGAYVSAVGINSVLDNRDIVRQMGDDAYVAWGYIMLVAVTLLIATFVFVAVAILLVIRFIYLVFLMVFSPIMFLGFIFPFFQNLSRQWFTTFLSQAAIAPAMMLMLYIALLIMINLDSALKSGQGGSSINWILHSQADTQAEMTALSMFALFILGSGFMIGALIAASKLGSSFASSSVAVLDKTRQGAQRWAVRTAGRSAAAAPAYVARQTVGRRAYNRLKSDEFKNKMAETAKTDPQAAMKMYQREKAKADNSYDVRNFSKWWSSNAVLGAQKGGYAADAKADEKLGADFAKALGTENWDKLSQEQQQEILNKNTEYKTAETTINEAKAEKTRIKDSVDGATEDLRNERGKLLQEMRSASREEAVAIKAQLDAVNQSISLKEQEYEADIKATEAKITRAEKQLEQQTQFSKANYVYQRQLALVTGAQNIDLEGKSANAAQLGVLGGYGATSIAGASVLGATGAGLLLGGIAAAAELRKQQRIKISFDKIVEDYKDPVAMMKKDKNKKSLEQLEEIRKESGIGDEDTKKDSDA